MGAYIAAPLGSEKGGLYRRVGRGREGETGGRGQKTTEHPGPFRMRTKALSRNDNRCFAIDGFVLFGLLSRK